MASGQTPTRFPIGGRTRWWPVGLARLITARRLFVGGGLAQRGWCPAAVGDFQAGERIHSYLSSVRNEAGVVEWDVTLPLLEEVQVFYSGWWDDM
jgi:hypothetical protein